MIGRGSIGTSDLLDPREAMEHCGRWTKALTPAIAG